MSIETSCQGCGHLLPQKARKCDHCGTAVATSQPKSDLPKYNQESIDRIIPSNVFSSDVSRYTG